MYHTLLFLPLSLISPLPFISLFPSLFPYFPPPPLPSTRFCNYVVIVEINVDFIQKLHLVTILLADFFSFRVANALLL